MNLNEMLLDVCLFTFFPLELNRNLFHPLNITMRDTPLDILFNFELREYIKIHSRLITGILSYVSQN